MNVLILSCNTGGGHNSCAKAIAAELQSRGHACRIDDALAYVSEGTSRFVSNWHVRFYRYFPNPPRPAVCCTVAASGCEEPSRTAALTPSSASTSSPH